MVLRGSYIYSEFYGSWRRIHGDEQAAYNLEKAVLGNGVICGGRDRECEWGMNSGSGEQLEAREGRMGLNRLGKLLPQVREKRNR